MLLCGCGRFGFGSEPQDVDTDARHVARADVPLATSVRITIAPMGQGGGQVIIDPPRAMCPPDCEVQVTTGTELRVSATANNTSWFAGWNSQVCQGRQLCTFNATRDTTIEARFTARPNRVFTSSVQHDGDFGGLPGADAFCAQLAATAQLSGTWIALLSSASQNIQTRLADSRGWVRVDGAPVADSSVALFQTPWHSIAIDENGAEVAFGEVWRMNTGCQDWMSAQPGDVGRRYDTRRAWAHLSGGGERACDTTGYLRCAEIGASVAIQPSFAAGRGAFTTDAAWMPSSGLAAADALCAAEAVAAGRSGTYRALLATTGASAISRFSDGPPWVRSDGMPLLPTAMDWNSAVLLDAAPGFNAMGVALSFSTIALGAPSPKAVGQAANTCDNWTSATGPMHACLETWTTRLECAVNTNCSVESELLCLEL